jgi:hypothetical protein
VTPPRWAAACGTASRQTSTRAQRQEARSSRCEVRASPVRCGGRPDRGGALSRPASSTAGTWLYETRTRQSPSATARLRRGNRPGRAGRVPARANVRTWPALLERRAGAVPPVSVCGAGIAHAFHAVLALARRGVQGLSRLS